jgi:hypothetical protein
MSVKDKIAMWNSIGSNPNTFNTNNNAPKVTHSAYTFKPTQQQEPPRTYDNPN